MYNSLYFKIVLILVIFMLTVMCVIGTVLVNSVNTFYTDQFENTMSNSLSNDGQLANELKSALSSDNYVSEQFNILNSYSAVLGIDDYRDFYILDEYGEYLEGSDDKRGNSLKKTANLLAAINKEEQNTKSLGLDFADYALRLENGERCCIIYIRDSMDEMQQFTWRLFSIILQALMFGIIFAILLAFFLSKAITSPIQSLTAGAKLIAKGEFTSNIDVHSKDEIGTLANTFDYMKNTLKNTLDEISGEHQKLETLFAYLRDGVVAFTDDGKVMHVNQSFTKLFGSKYDNDFTLSKLIKLLGIDYTADFDVQYVDRKDDRPYDGYNASDVMFDGKVLDISFAKFHYAADNSSHDGILAVIHDETGRYELDRSRREFVANVSHEMRTPLTSIKGACETILNDRNIPQDMEEFFLHMAVDECDRMTRIVADLLVLSRLDNKRTQWHIQTYDPDAALKHICDVMQVDAAAHSHTLEYSPIRPLPSICADRERIDQVIINVLSNAIKYTPDGGKIELGAKADKEYIEITVRDNGIGIPKEDLPHLFERFYRVEKSRTSETGGTGLGLAIAREITEAHGGSITMDSKLGEGTLVTLKLPIETKLKTVE